MSCDINFLVNSVWKKIFAVRPFSVSFFERNVDEGAQKKTETLLLLPFFPVLLDDPRNPVFQKKYTFFVVRARLRRALSFY